MMYPLKVLLNAFAIIFFLSGMFFFELLADFDYNPFSLGNNTYYVWDKLSYLLIICCVIYPVRAMKYQFYILMSLCFFRLLYELPVIQNWNQMQESHLWFSVIVCHFLASIAQLVSFAIMENDRTVVKNWCKKNNPFIAEENT